MSSAGRCIARSTSSGMLVGPGMARNSRPARTVIVVGFLTREVMGMDAILSAEFQGGGRSFRQRIGDCMPDLIFQLGCGRARNHVNRARLFVTVLHQTQDPDLAIG